MAKKEDKLGRIAKDIEFLKDTMLTRLPEKVQRLEQENEKLKLENNVFNDEKKLLLETNKRLERKKGDNELLFKTIEDMKLNLASKQSVVAKLQEEIDKLKEAVVDFRDKEVNYEIDDKKKTQQLEIIIKRLKAELFKKHMLMSKFDETKKIMEQQIYALSREKGNLADENRLVIAKLQSLVQAMRKHEALSTGLKGEFSMKLSEQKNQYEEMIRRLNEINMREVLDKNASVAAMQKRIKQMQQMLVLKDEKHKKMLDEFEGLIRKESS